MVGCGRAVGRTLRRTAGRRCAREVSSLIGRVIFVITKSGARGGEIACRRASEVCKSQFVASTMKSMVRFGRSPQTVA